MRRGLTDKNADHHLRVPRFLAGLFLIFDQDLDF